MYSDSHKYGVLFYHGNTQQVTNTKGSDMAQAIEREEQAL